MSAEDLAALTDDELAQKFRALSLRQFECRYDDDQTMANRLYDEREKIAAILKSRGPEARRVLLPLLNHKNPQVRLDAAHQLLAIEPARARAALVTVAQGIPSIATAQARSALRRLDEGAYKPE